MNHYLNQIYKFEESKNQKVNILIIGCGAVAYRWYLKGLSESDNCKIIAVVDVNVGRAKKVAEEFNILYFGNDYKEIIQDIDIKVDIALVLTGHKSHYEIISNCLDLGINVYSEKPFAQCFNEGIKLVRKAENVKRTLCSAPQVMFSSRNQTMRKLIYEKKIGETLLVRASGSNLGPADRPGYNDDPKWFYQDGGSMSSLGIYTLSILTYIWGLPERVCGYYGTAYREREVKQGICKGESFIVTAPDNEVALLDYGNGKYILLDGSYCVMHTVEHEFIVHGTEGTLYVGGFGGRESVVMKSKDTIDFLGPDDDCHLKWNLSWGVEEMAQSLLENRKPLANAKFALQAIAVMDCIKLSNDRNSIINVSDYCEQNI